MNGYEPLLQETDGGLVCRDCMTFCYFGSKVLTPCDVDGCTCDACERLRRALELDDRPEPALANIARDLEAEARPDVDALMEPGVMVRVRRHMFVASDVTDWRGKPAGCRHCPLPADNEIHGVELPSEEQMAVERRRVGERE